MRAKQLVRLSNTIGIISIILLIYWIFTFITIEVFGLKVFRRNLTEIFYMSVMGILALMTGALIVNIMFNLTRIAEKHHQDEIVSSNQKISGWVLIAIFPVIFVALFYGDYLTSKKKEQLLVKSAQSIIDISENKKNHLLNYQFDRYWVIKTNDILNILSLTDENLNNIAILVKDTIDETSIFLEFSTNYYIKSEDSLKLEKKNFIRKTTEEERIYLNKVFDDKTNEYRFSSYDGQYEIFYPYSDNQRKIVIYFSKRNQYGKIGS